MAQLNAARLDRAREMAHNWLTNNDLDVPGKGEPRKVESRDALATEFWEGLSQFKNRYGANQAVSEGVEIHMSGDANKGGDPGTGGLLIGLLEHYAKVNYQDAMQVARDLDVHGAHVGYINCETLDPLPIKKSPCSTGDLTLFAQRQGLWAGWQP